MNAIPYDGPEEEWDSYEDEPDVALPGRPRRKVLTWWSAGLFALILGAVGFYVGVRIEKNQLANSTLDQRVLGAARAPGPARARRRRHRARRAAHRRGGSHGRRPAAAARASAACSAAPAARVAAPRSARSAASAATHSSSPDTSGNTVKVTLSSATKVTKNVTVGKKAVRPGDLVTVAGAKGSNGTVSATTVNDTGASPAAAASSGSGSSRLRKQRILSRQLAVRRRMSSINS